MKFQGTMRINESGHLVIDEELLRRNCKEYHNSFAAAGDRVLYASKAFLVKALCRIIQAEGLGLDVVSGGELYIALQAGFPPDKICFHGNNKSLAELQYALESSVGRIVIDNFHELELLKQLTAGVDRHPQVLLRIAPGIEPHSHGYVKTGQTDSKFGFTLANGDARRAVSAVLEADYLNLVGLHCHIGSQILELESFRHTAAVMVDFLQDLRASFDWTASELDLGGGLGTYFTANDEPPAISSYAAAIREAVEASCRQYGYPRPRLLVEPGRSVISSAGTTIYTVGAIKDIPGIRKYVAVDGGLSDNLRPALYQAQYEGLLANKAGLPPQEMITVSGRCCESGDMLIHNLHVPRVASGDLLAISCTGAYTYSMSSNYNGLPRLAVVLVRDSQANLIVARETYANLVEHHLVPERLAGNCSLSQPV